jgi:carboxypeptidase Q
LEVNIPCGGLDTGAEGLKTQAEADIFGGTPGIQYDPNYHGPGDTVANMSLPFFEINAKAIAHATATYALSFDGFPARVAPAPGRRREAKPPARFYKKPTYLSEE